MSEGIILGNFYIPNDEKKGRERLVAIEGKRKKSDGKSTRSLVVADGRAPMLW